MRISKYIPFLDLSLIKSDKVVVQPKYDGQYCKIIVNNGFFKMFSRNDRLIKEGRTKLPEGIYEGEYLFGTSWSLNHKQYGKIILFNYINTNTTYYLERLKYLYSLQRLFPDWMRVIEYEVLERDKKQIINYFKKCVNDEDFEGIVIRDAKDTENLVIKMKQRVTVDYVITGFNKDKNNKVKSFLVGLYFKDGNKMILKTIGKVNIGNAKIKRECEINPQKYLYKVIEVTGYGIFKSGIVRHGYLVRFREDKKKEECLYEKIKGSIPFNTGGF